MRKKITYFVFPISRGLAVCLVIPPLLNEWSIRCYIVGNLALSFFSRPFTNLVSRENEVLFVYRQMIFELRCSSEIITKILHFKYYHRDGFLFLATNAGIAIAVLVAL